MKETRRPARTHGDGLSRRRFIEGSTAAGLAGAGGVMAAPRSARGQAQRAVRVWGEPGPYGGVAVAAMNEWAQKNAPNLKFEIETIPWDGVYVKLMTDLAARRPPNLISVESPIAYQLMAEGLLEPLDDVVGRVGRDRMIAGMKWEYWGHWKGAQYVLPAHHQPHLLLVRMDIINELGLGDPANWSWTELLNAAKTVSQKKTMAGFTMALGRNLCTDYHFSALLHQAGGRMFAVEDNYAVAFDSPATVEALEFVKELRATMPKGAVEYSFLQVVDAHVTGQTAMSFYWGRTLGRAADEAKEVFKHTEAFQHARHPRTGNRSNWNDFQGWCIPRANNPFVKEVKEALVYFQTSKEWLIRYCHSLMPNVSPVYKDIAEAPELAQHPFFETKRDTIRRYYVESLAHTSNTGNELLKGINPLAGIIHGRSVLAQTVQRVVIDNQPPAEAAKWGARELESIRREHLRLIT